jgi:hypothetical protein
MTEHSQNSDWADFYEDAWAFRAAFIEKLIQTGESHPLRLISSLEAKQRKFGPESDPKTNSVLFQKRRFDQPAGPSGLPLTKVTSFLGSYLDAPFYAETPLQNYIVDYFDEHGPFDAIVELGCGFGQNLFKIFYNGGPRIPYFGGELTQSGVSLAKRLGGFASAGQFSFFQFNHLTPDLSQLPRFKKVLFFTMHTIEQVHRIDTSLIKTIAASADEVTCLHFEPFGFQMKELGETTRDQKNYFTANRWNENLALVLSEAHQAGIIQIAYAGLEIFYPDDPANPTSLAIWHSKQAASR